MEQSPDPLWVQIPVARTSAAKLATVLADHNFGRASDLVHEAAREFVEILGHRVPVPRITSHTEAIRISQAGGLLASVTLELWGSDLHHRRYENYFADLTEVQEILGEDGVENLRTAPYLQHKLILACIRRRGHRGVFEVELLDPDQVVVTA